MTQLTDAAGRPLRPVLAWLLAWGCGLGAGAEPPASRAEPPVVLSEAEKAWLVAHPVVRVGHDATYAPWSFPGHDGELVGIDLDFLALISERTGLKFRNEVRDTWTHMLDEFRAGRVDLLMSLAKTEERHAYMDFSKAYTLAPNVIVTRSDRDFIFDVGELKGRRVATVGGYIGLRYIIMEQAPDCVLVDYADTQAVLDAVARGDVYAGVTDVVNASYLVRTRRLANLRLAGMIGGPSDLFIGVRKGAPELVSILDKAIDSITPADRRRINNQWIGIDYEADLRWVRVAKVAAVLAGAAVVVFLVVFWHNRSMAAELARRRQVQAELEQAHVELGRVNEEKTELLRMVAHDLRSPLTGVMLAAEFLQFPEIDLRAARETAGKIRPGLRQMARLINDLVDVNALESGQRTFAWGEVDVMGVVHDCVAALAETAARKGIRIELQAPVELPSIRSDGAAVRQVLENLATNAIKYSPAGAGVEIGARPAAEGVELFVRDHGPGMSADDLGRLFEKYARGSAQPTGGEQSTGLGLWIVRRLVEGLGGKVRCESAPGQGAYFVVWLPAATGAAER